MPLDFVKALLGRGYAVASINYRISSEAVFPAQIHDVKAAVRFLRAHANTYSVDPDRIAAAGESSGAHLLALLAVTQGTEQLDDATLGLPDVSSAVRSVLLFYPQIDFLQARAWLVANPACTKGFNDVDKADSAESRLLGAAVPTVTDRARAANPITYLSTARALPPIFIAHGDADCTTPYQGSQEFARRVAAVAGPDAVRFDLVHGSGHYLAFDYAAEMGAVSAFLTETIGQTT